MTEAQKRFQEFKKELLRNRREELKDSSDSDEVVEIAKDVRAIEKAPTFEKLLIALRDRGWDKSSIIDWIGRSIFDEVIDVDLYEWDT